MARIVDYLKKLLKKNRVINDDISENRVVNDRPIMLSLLMSVKSENLDFGGVIDLNKEQVCKVLGEITELNIVGNFTQESLRQLKLVLGYMTGLKRLSIINMADNERIDITSVLDSLDMNVEEIELSGVNISDGIREDISKKLEKLKKFSIENSNIPKIPVFPADVCKVVLGEKLDNISEIDCICYSTNSEIKNDLIVNDGVKQIIEDFKGNVIPLYLYEKDQEFISHDNICISINDISELDLEKLQMLKKDKRIKNIAIKGEFNSKDKEAWYSIDEYTAIREAINKIVSEVELPEDNDPDREKKIFAQVYKLLGERISYDYYAISDEGKKDKQLEYDCRNLKNGLLGVERDGQKQYLTVCAGYADILRNVLACLGIESKYITSFSWVLYEEKNGEWVPKVDENGKQLYRNGTIDPRGHAYNLVTLDGQKYYCDLTWDAPNIKRGRYPLENFLVSYENFLISHENVGFYKLLADEKANISLSYEKQCELLCQGIKAKDKVEEMAHENYLSGFVTWYLGCLQCTIETLKENDLWRIMSDINKMEEKILSSEAKDKNILFNFGTAEYTFDTTDKEKRKKLRSEIKERWRGKSGHDSR